MSEKSSEKTSESKAPVLEDHVVETEHSITIDGEEIPYTVTTGRIVLREESEGKGEKAGESEGEKARATMFFIAYTRRDAGDLSSRPITFSFNGGPGSSSVWLHLGMIGPRRVVLDDVGNLTQPPHGLTDNEYSLLDRTDMVFIDPVGTGYSRPVEGEKAAQFHNFKKDIESVGDFIRLYTTRYHRWTSPKFLIGESYGTTRAAGLSEYLQQRHGMYLNGLMLISSILDFGTVLFLPGNDLPYVLHLPTYTATAWYHKRLEASLQKDLRKTLAEVEAFALGDYASALMKGDALSAAERKTIAQKLARYTGLSEDYIDRTNLRVEIMRFCKELLRDQRRTVGRLDSRFTGMDRDAAGEYPDHDPSMTNIMGPYTSAFNDYVRRDLGFVLDLPYEILSFKTHEAWKYDEHQNRYVHVAEALRQAMTINPYLKIFVANGYFDFATPYLATRYTFNHMALDESLRKNIEMGFYEGGHMMYLHIPSLEQLKKDLSGWLDEAVPQLQ